MTKSNLSASYPQLYLIFFKFHIINQIEKKIFNHQKKKTKKTKNLFHDTNTSVSVSIPHLPEVKLAVIIRHSKTTILPHPGSIVSIIQE